MQLTTNERTSAPKKSFPNWMIIAAAIYLALPIDVIPILGLVGDLGALMIALKGARQDAAASQEANGDA